MHRYQRTDLEACLRAVDAELAAPCVVVLVGGAVASLAWRAMHATADIDVWAADPEFWAACRKLTAEKRLFIPVQRATIAEPPQEFEGRLEPLAMPGLQHLQVNIPEPHDWAIMKVARGVEADFRAVEELHQHAPLAVDTLVSRYRETLVMGPRSRFRLKFLDLVSRLFEESVAERVAALLATEP